MTTNPIQLCGCDSTSHHAVLGVCCCHVRRGVRDSDYTRCRRSKSFYKRLAEVSQSLALVLVGDFNFPNVCWKYNTAERKQSRRFLECVEDNFLTQLVPPS
ncbi:uncharacterized protein LOC143156778 isoform X2 [Aptenodytes patagonicus]|uniref:uncharacterized protein LOC143156778 isoform X2 n=1 Tax=Aptenodytes patagonicus TaxID=9234 RepID=UPI003F9F4FD8